MRLRITTPSRVIVDHEVSYVQSEDASGRFGILPGHERFLTTVVPSILVYRSPDGGTREHYVAIRHGVFRVTEEGVEIAVRDAHVSDDLAKLEEEIRRARERRGGRDYRSMRSLYQMQVAAWRRLMEYEDVRTRQG